MNNVNKYGGITDCEIMDKRVYNRTHMPKGRKFKFFPPHPSYELEVSNGVASVTVKED